MSGTDGPPISVLLTGGGGFVGTALKRTLSARHPDWVVIAPRAIGADVEDGLDVCDPRNVEHWIVRARPDVVVHLAAIAAVSASNSDPRLAWKVNVDGTLNVVLALQQHAPEAFLLHMSSGDIYGASAERGALTEETLPRPLNAYAASKAAAELFVQQAATHGLKAAIMRPFNQIGAGQSAQFAIASFASQVARIEAGLQPPVLLVGNLADERDFIDVRDSADAYVSAIERRGEIAGSILNISSGISRTIASMLDELLKMATIHVEVRVDEQRFRPTTSAAIVADATRARRMLDWGPRREISSALAALLDEKRADLTIGASA